MSNSVMTPIINVWKRNELGTGMFIVGTISCMIGVILSFSGNMTDAAEMIGVGIPFILAGTNIILQPSKLPIYEMYKGFYGKCIEGNWILILECLVPTISITLFFQSYPDNWNDPIFYMVFIPYGVCIFLLTINILFSTDEKDREIDRIREELKKSHAIIREKEEMCKDDAAPNYAIDFATGINRNIDELKSIMDTLKGAIDSGAKDIAMMTASVANKYRSDNTQLHNDVQNFKQRAEKEKADFKERVNERMIKNLMNTLYEIDELRQYKDKGTSYTIGDIDKIKDNIYSIFRDEEIDIINPSIGDNFDDKKCCAIQTIETDKFPGNKIVDIKKIGCMFKSGKVIKYADVVVSKSNVKTDEGVDTKIEDKAKTEDAKVDIKTKPEDNKADNKIKTGDMIKADNNVKIGDNKVDNKHGFLDSISAFLASLLGGQKVEDTNVDIKTKVEDTKVDNKIKTGDKTKVDNKIKIVDKAKVYVKPDKVDINTDVYVKPDKVDISTKVDINADKADITTKAEDHKSKNNDKIKK